MKRGLAQPGGKLPLFDDDGQRYSPRTVRSCLDQGWVTPWIGNPLKPDWLVCKLTEAGRNAVSWAGSRRANRDNNWGRRPHLRTPAPAPKEPPRYGSRRPKPCPENQTGAGTLKRR